MGKDKINHLECIKIAFKMIYEVDKNSFAITIILSIVSGVFPFLVLKLGQTIINIIQSHSTRFDNILNNLNDKIIIYITHRIRCAMNSDRIIVMDNGKIVGDGSHDDLIENCNRYKLMYNKEFK
ncbi:hypothetical protein [Anaerococcus vaginalis]|uniref:hypothetical protein n=1 Tax=Anaerococcus vaginalis TaxID=33037 RepID=UPI0022E47666|nr:hypothetical protein [Anaerococcus vaginalis]MDU1583042.1 hypothetical protein [Peptoniphilus harei]MDU1664334.1 hypothetical protein [Peptoniphilus harei]